MLKEQTYSTRKSNGRPQNHRAIPIYTSTGRMGALMRYPYIFNVQGEWIGWVAPTREVYSVHGHYVGWMTKDPRILRKRTFDHTQPRRTPPSNPPRLRPPSSVPLAPLLPELKYSELDVLEDMPELMPTLDAGELREDMD